MKTVLLHHQAHYQNPKPRNHSQQKQYSNESLIGQKHEELGFFQQQI